MADDQWIVSTKLYIPESLDRLVPRSRLTDLLDKGVRLKLTLVCAPAGSGKTTLLGEWVKKQQDAVAWVSLDEYDNAFHRFWGHIITAINLTSHQFLDRMTPALTNVQSSSFETLLFQVINELNLMPERRLILVLDDYHVIHDPDIHRSVAYFLERMPNHVHCVLAARFEPPLPFPRFAARGQLARLTGLQLNFTLQEGFDFCRLLHEQMPKQHIRQLMLRTEGWIAGMKLALLSWQDHHDDERLFHLIVNRHVNIADYLFQEVYRQLPPEDQQFLLYSSILRKLYGPLCEAVTGQTNGERKLESLERANMFLTVLDGQGIWFRYHHLFAEFLKHELRRNEPTIIPILHKRAAEWLERSGFPTDAVEHYLSGEHYEIALKIICKLLPEMLNKEWETLLRWMSSIPEHLLERSPELYLAYMFFLTAAEQDRNRLEMLIRRGEELFAASNGEWPQHIHNEYRASLYLVKALYAKVYLDNIELAIEYMQACVRFAPDGILLQNIEINPGEMSILRAFRKACADLSGLERFFKIMIELWQCEEPYVFTGFFYVGYGELCCERDELERGEQAAAEGWRIAKRNRSGKLLAPAAVALSSIYYAQQRVEKAYEILRDAESCLKEWGFGYWAHQLKAQRIRLQILDMPAIPSDLRQTIHMWVEENGDLAQEDIPFHQFFMAISLVRGWMALDRLQEAETLLKKLENKARETRRLGEFQEILILLALCSMRQNRHKMAVSFLDDALAIAEPNRSVRPFMDETPDIAKLLKLYRQRKKDASSLVKHLAGRYTRRNSSRTEAAAAGATNLLTPKEREVLELMATGMPNRLIAERLGISLGTVKTHVNHIFQKLMVKDRWSAIELARSQWEM